MPVMTRRAILGAIASSPLWINAAWAQATKLKISHQFPGGTINEGDMNRCPATWPKPAGTVGSVHTHPIWGPGSKDVGSAGQVFSEGDFSHAEHADVGVATYLGAPAGHVLRYDPGGSTCWGKSFIARKFKIVRDLSPTVNGRLPLDSGVKTPLFDQGGKPIAKPPYCREPSR